MLRSKIGMSVSAALLLGMVSITGCGNNNSASGNNVQTNSVRGMDGTRLNANAVDRDASFNKMEVSQKLADRVAAMPEVRTANVMVAGKSAYVAVTLDDARGGVHAQSFTDRNPGSLNPALERMNVASETAGLNRMTGMNGTGMNRMTGMNGTTGLNGTTGMIGDRGSVTGTPGMTGTGGSMTGIPGNYTGTGTVGGTALTNPGAYPGNGGNSIYSGDRGMSGRYAGTRPSTSAGMGIRSVTPYSGTGTQTDTTSDVTQGLKDKIADEVKRADTRIQNVYVSANPDFVERANYYADEFRAGHPLRGFAHEFRVMVERIFPTRSGY